MPKFFGFLIFLLFLIGCSSTQKGNRDIGSVGDDFQIVVKNPWVLKSDGNIKGRKSLHLKIHAPSDVKKVLITYPGMKRAKILSRRSKRGGPFSTRIPVSRLNSGIYEIKAKSKNGKYGFTHEFYVSYPLYVIVSTDWDDTRGDNDLLDRVTRLHKRFPGLKITHFFGPYNYSDPKVPPKRKQEITDFMIDLNRKYGDEIGLHIHCYCHFMKMSGVPCRDDVMFAAKSDITDPTRKGQYTVLASYPEREMIKILETSIQLFKENGLGRPISFRAGGWSADLGTLRLLNKLDFKIDSSAVASQFLNWPETPKLYKWTSRNWKGINDTSQPYYPGYDNHLAPGDNPMGILQVPDNGALVDYVDYAEDMIKVFRKNYDIEKKILDRPTVYQIGFHPTNEFFFEERLIMMMDTLKYIESYLHRNKGGPGVYGNIKDLLKVKMFK